jgi:hypothetical protein
MAVLLSNHKTHFSHFPLHSLVTKRNSTFLFVEQTDMSLNLKINPLNAELNPICHLLILLGDLPFMSTCIVSIFEYISKKMQRYTVCLYLETTLHFSGGTFTHHQERIHLYLQHLLFVTPLLLSAAIVEELELVCTPPTAHSNQFQLFHDSGRQQ